MCLAMHAPHPPSTCARLLRVLAEPTRLEVLRRLLQSPAHVSVLLGALEVDQTLLSHHLGVLRDAGLVEAEREGRSVLYRIAAGAAVQGHRETIDLGCCRLTFH